MTAHDDRVNPVDRALGPVFLPDQMSTHLPPCKILALGLSRSPLFPAPLYHLDFRPVSISPILTIAPVHALPLSPHPAPPSTALHGISHHVARLISSRHSSPSVKLLCHIFVSYLSARLSP